MKRNSLILSLGISVFILWGCSEGDNQPLVTTVVKHDCIELNKIKTIKAQCVYDDRLEKRIQRLVYLPFEEYQIEKEVEVYSPIDGTIVDVYKPDRSQPLRNLTVTIQEKSHHEIYVILESIDLNSDEWGESKIVKAGMQIGYIHFQKDGTGMALQTFLENELNRVDISFLKIAEEYVFNNYHLRGIESTVSLYGGDLILRFHENKDFEKVYKLKPIR